MIRMLKLWLKRRSTKTVLVDPPLDFCEISCDAYGLATLVEVDASELRQGQYPVRMKDEDRPGAVQIFETRSGRLLHSIAPPRAVGPRGREIGPLVFSVYVRQLPNDITVSAYGAIEKYAIIKVKKTDTRK